MLGSWTKLEILLPSEIFVKAGTSTCCSFEKFLSFLQITPGSTTIVGQDTPLLLCFGNRNIFKLQGEKRRKSSRVGKNLVEIPVHIQQICWVPLIDTEILSKCQNVAISNFTKPLRFCSGFYTIIIMENSCFAYWKPKMFHSLSTLHANGLSKAMEYIVLKLHPGGE